MIAVLEQLSNIAEQLSSAVPSLHYEWLNSRHLLKLSDSVTRVVELTGL